MIISSSLLPTLARLARTRRQLRMGQADARAARGLDDGVKIPSRDDARGYPVPCATLRFGVVREDARPESTRATEAGGDFTHRTG